MYQVLNSRNDWDKISQELLTLHTHPINEGRLKTILELVPDVFSLEVGRLYYPVAFGGGVTKDTQIAALTQACTTGEGSQLKDFDVANILSRACWMVKPEELE